MTRFLPQWKIGTWAFLLFTAWLILMWATTASAAPILMWFIGLFVALGLWLLSGPKLNVRIYGPNGQEWMVSAATAERRVRGGWSYEPQPSQP